MLSAFFCLSWPTIMQPTHAAPKKKPARRDEGAVGLEVVLAFWEPLCPSPRGRHKECPDNWKKEKSCEREPERQIKYETFGGFRETNAAVSSGGRARRGVS